MNTKKLALDYLDRAKKRMRALEALMEEKDYADVIRESQEILELALKGTLRFIGIEPSKKHDVGDILKRYKHKLPDYWQDSLEEIVRLSQMLTEERSHAFYGDESNTVPASELFTKKDAERSIKSVSEVLELFDRLVQENK